MDGMHRVNVTTVMELLGVLADMVEHDPMMRDFRLAGPFQEINAVECDAGDYADHIVYFTHKRVGEL